MPPALAGTLLATEPPGKSFKMVLEGTKMSLLAGLYIFALIIGGHALLQGSSLVSGDSLAPPSVCTQTGT